MASMSRRHRCPVTKAEGAGPLEAVESSIEPEVIRWYAGAMRISPETSKWNRRLKRAQRSIFRTLLELSRNQLRALWIFHSTDMLLSRSADPKTRLADTAGEPKT